MRVYSPASHKTFNVFPDSDPRARKAQIPLDEVSGWEALQPIVDVVIEEGDNEGETLIGTVVVRSLKPNRHKFGKRPGFA